MNKETTVLAYGIRDACTASGLGRTRLYGLIADGLIEARTCGRRTSDPSPKLAGLPRQSPARADPPAAREDRRGRARRPPLLRTGRAKLAWRETDMTRRRRNRIAEQFVYHTRKMRESPAWRALPNNARRVLDRLELGHMHQGGKENGRLKCTYGDFERAGIRRQSVGLAIRQCFELGFLEVTQRGYQAQNGFQVVSTYRLTYVYPADHKVDTVPTDDWKRIRDEASAAAHLERANTPWPRGQEPPPWTEI